MYLQQEHPICCPQPVAAAGEAAGHIGEAQSQGLRVIGGQHQVDIGPRELYPQPLDHVQGVDGISDITLIITLLLSLIMLLDKARNGPVLLLQFGSEGL